VQQTVQPGRAASYTTSSEVSCPTELQQFALPDDNPLYGSPVTTALVYSTGNTQT